MKESEDVKARRLSRRSDLSPASSLGLDTLTILPSITEYDLEADSKGALLSELRSDLDDQLAPYGFETSLDLLHWLASSVQQSPLARALFMQASDTAWKIRLERVEDGAYSLDADEKIICLDQGILSANAIGRAGHLRSTILGAFIKALREAVQDGALPKAESTFRPEDVLMAERVRAADADLVLVQSAWELRAAGQSELWRHVLSGEDGDLALVFACAIEKNPASQYNGQALSHSFTQWFEDNLRVDGAEHRALEILDTYLSQTDNAEDLGTQRLSAEQVEQISTLPGQICYLEGRGAEILNGPAFSGLSDPINQAHLFQIVYDSKVTRKGGVPFRDQSLARKLFPEQ